MENIYSRTIQLIGNENMQTLQQAHVVIFGVGGVGGYVVEALARAGVGNLTVVDNDTIHPSNLNRQIYALHSTMNQSKVDACKARVHDINPQCNVHAQSVWATPENIKDIFPQNATYCIDCIDTITSKLAIIKACKEAHIPCISCMGTGNKLNPFVFKIDDISKTTVCPLAKTMRKLLKENNIQNVPVLYSTEPAQKVCAEEANGRHAPASISYIPAVAGNMLAGFVICKLLGVKI